MGWPIDMVRTGCESSIDDHDIDLCVIMVGWMDVPDSDWGDFRRWWTLFTSSNVMTFEYVVNIFLQSKDLFNQ